MTTLEDLYPGGVGYHRAHEGYIGAVAEVVAAAGYEVYDWSAEPNDPRDGVIILDTQAMSGDDQLPIWSNGEVNVAWSEDRGWSLVTVEESFRNDGRFVFDLPVARLASPETVANAVAAQIGEQVTVPADNFPDADFPEHTFEDDDVPFELALAVYRQVP